MRFLICYLSWFMERSEIQLFSTHWIRKQGLLVCTGLTMMKKLLRESSVCKRFLYECIECCFWLLCSTYSHAHSCDFQFFGMDMLKVLFCTSKDFVCNLSIPWNWWEYIILLCVLKFNLNRQLGCMELEWM